jgi:homogentisate 1,2-dioxygenase
MLDRAVSGEVASKHHLALRGPGGVLRHEECITRGGFDGPYSILYHLNRPHTLVPAGIGHVAAPLRAAGAGPLEVPALLRRHFRTSEVPAGGAPMDARAPLLFNEDVTLYVVKSISGDPAYFVNGDGDELYYALEGSGVVRSVFGDLEFAAGDYVCVPKGTLHRLVAGADPMHLLLVECKGGLGLPAAYRNGVGQLRMDAPYCHRDFRRPAFVGPLDEGIREVVVKRGDAYHGFTVRHSPLDVVGWDGTVYPFVFPILAFQPRVGMVHLPPTQHATFEARGALVCSFVPRPLDFHPDAVPCPYPHSSVDVDEVLFYARGEFTSRTGVSQGSLTLHPRGLTHGPHPDRYESSPATRTTDEVAVMLDCARPLTVTAVARSIEDEGYERSFIGG